MTVPMELLAMHWYKPSCALAAFKIFTRFSMNSDLADCESTRYFLTFNKMTAKSKKLF